MIELWRSISGFTIIVCIIGAVISFCFVDYYMYKYLMEKGKVKGYWDFNSYMYGRNNWRKYKIVFDTNYNQHSQLKKAKCCILLYWGLLILVLFCVLFLSAT